MKQICFKESYLDKEEIIFIKKIFYNIYAVQSIIYQMNINFYNILLLFMQSCGINPFEIPRKEYIDISQKGKN